MVISDIKVVVSRGQLVGKTMRPAMNKAGKYVVSMTRFEKDYHYVTTVEEIVRAVRDGFSVRMSVGSGYAASLISAKKIIKENPEIFK